MFCNFYINLLYSYPINIFPGEDEGSVGPSAHFINASCPEGMLNLPFIHCKAEGVNFRFNSMPPFHIQSVFSQCCLRSKVTVYH